MDKDHAEKVIVFGNRRDETRRLAERLSKDGIRAALMSGEIPQQKRVRTLEDFRSGKIQVLVATDVAGRGIHIDGVTHVFNYQLPEDPDDYVHRIGRTGRAGASGASICFACEDDSFLIPEIEAETGVKLECVHPEADLLLEPKAKLPEVEKNAEGESEGSGENEDPSLLDPSETLKSIGVQAETAPNSDSESVMEGEESQLDKVETVQQNESEDVSRG